MTRQKLSNINVEIIGIDRRHADRAGFSSKKSALDEDNSNGLMGSIWLCQPICSSIPSLFEASYDPIYRSWACSWGDQILTFFNPNWQSPGFTAGLIYAFIQYVSQLFPTMIDVTQNFATLEASTISARRVLKWWIETTMNPSRLVAWKRSSREYSFLSMYLFLIWWQTGCPKKSPLRSKADKPASLFVGRHHWFW